MGGLYLIPDPARLGESCALARQYGACFEYNDFYDPALLDDAERLAKRMSLYLSLERDRSGDTLHGAFFDVTVHSGDPKIRQVSEDRVMRSLEIASRMGLRGAVFHTGTIPNFLDDRYEETWLRRNAAFWRRAAAAYPDTEILMENMFDMRSDLLFALAEELRDLPRFGVCLDCAHAAVFGREGGTVEGWINRFAPYIRHFHINDNDGRSDLHEAVGGGVIDWPSFDRAARAVKGSPSVLVEVRPLETQRRSLEYMQAHRVYPFD